MLGKYAFKSLSRDSLKVMGAWASKKVLKIYCKSSLVYLRIKNLVVEMIAKRGLAA